MIKIYGSPLSSAGRCFWALEELGLPYEVMPIDMRAKEHKSESFLRLNPNGKVPVLVDGDFVLWESMAITNYLVKKHKSPLAAQNDQEEGLVLQWSFWALVEFQTPAVSWLIQEFFVPEDKRNHQVIDNAKKSLPHLLNVLDGALHGKTYLVSERFSVADINVASVVNILIGLKYDLSPYANVQKWFKSCSERPAFKKIADMRKH
ncbi:MAG: glutathione S-transferase family protein [Bdellovibrio sp.]|nr:glutathione S-transferase family protein [Bdellovibrio sp.]